MGNIPYYLTGEILFKLLDERRTYRGLPDDAKGSGPEDREPSHSRAYGALSVIFRLYAAAKVLFFIKPGLFIPPPKVESAFISIVFKDTEQADRGLIDFVKSAFRYKRKYLRHCLEGKYAPDELDALYSHMGFLRLCPGGGDRAGGLCRYVPVPYRKAGGLSGVVGFTTTIPVEVIFASGLRPCDLNNVFVTHPDPQHYVALAEREGFPRNMCSWIKGIYGVVVESKIDTVITVLEGDCSNTRALAEVLAYKGVRIVPFSFPYDRRGKAFRREIGRLADRLRR